MSKNIPLIILVLGFVFTLGYLTRYNRGNDGDRSRTAEADTVILRDTSWQYDTIEIPAYIPKPYPVPVIDTFWKTKPIDTMAILQAYYNKNAYSDTVVNDSNLLVVINDTISHNKVQSRVPFVVRNFPTITNTIYATKDEWFIGGYFGKSFGAEVSYRHHKNMYGAGYGTNGVYLKYSRQIK